MSNETAAGVRTEHTFCRVCHASCPMEVDIEDNKVIAVRGVMDDPLFEGYTCIKGRQIPDQMADPKRIRQPLRRRPDGTFEEIDERRSPRRDRRRTPPDHRHLRAARRCVLHRHRRVPELGRRTGSPRIPPRSRLGVVLHIGHHRPAREGPRDAPPRRLGGRIPLLHRLRRPHGDRLQLDGLVVRTDRRPAGDQPVHGDAPPQGRGHEADRRSIRAAPSWRASPTSTSRSARARTRPCWRA